MWENTEGKVKKTINVSSDRRSDSWELPVNEDNNNSRKLRTITLQYDSIYVVDH